MLLSASCGRQHDAESAVKDFMEANLAEGSHLSEVSLQRIDSTRHVNDSIVKAIRQTAQQAPQPYKAKVNYIDNANGQTLITCRAHYKVNGKAYSGVFYLDNALTGVVDFIFHEE